MIYYGVVMLITVVALGLIQKGFFWKFIKVKTSMGKLIMVKIREVNRDHYKIGSIEGGWLIYKVKGKDVKRIAIPKDRPTIYRSVGIGFVDVDSEKNAVCTADYTTVSGFDAEKNNDLYLRSLYKPQINDNKEKIMLGLIVVGIIVSLIVGYLVIQQQESINIMVQQLSTMQGSVTGSSTI